MKNDLENYVSDLENCLKEATELLGGIKQMLEVGVDIEHVDTETFMNYKRYKDYLESEDFRDAKAKGIQIERQKKTIQELQEENKKLSFTISKFENSEKNQKRHLPTGDR